MWPSRRLTCSLIVLVALLLLFGEGGANALRLRVRPRLERLADAVADATVGCWVAHAKLPSAISRACFTARIRSSNGSGIASDNISDMVQPSLPRCVALWSAIRKSRTSSSSSATRSQPRS
jgi:hypothetical protein